MKIKFFVILFAAVSLSLCWLSCSKEQAQYEQPMLSLEPGKADFGNIPLNDPIAFHDVSLTARNLGKEALRIDKIELPDGFDYELIPRRDVIEGGEKAIIKVTIDSRRFSGPVAATAYVLCNVPDQPRIPIPLHANLVETSSAKSDTALQGPRIQFDHRGHDFGAISRSEMVEHQFPFKNVGQKPLKILGIETMCLCLTGYATKTEIAPGESAAIVARIEPYKYDGVSPWKSLVLKTNDMDEHIVNISVSAKIVDAAFLEPDSIVFPNIQKGVEAKAQVKLLQQGAQELKIKRIDTSSPNITVTTSSLEEDEKGFLLDVTVSPDMSLGKFEEVATIFTNYQDYSRLQGQGGAYKNYAQLRLPVKGSVSGTISLSPQKINFGSCAPGEVVKRKLIVTSAAAGFEIKKLSLSDPGFRIQQNSLEVGRKYEITIEFRPEPPEREISDELVISTRDTEFRVPVFAAVTPTS